MSRAWLTGYLRSPLLRFPHEIILLLGLWATAVPARALINVGNVNQINVRAFASVGWSSNIAAQAVGADDFSLSAGVDVDYVRRAGYLTLDASAGLTRTQFRQSAGSYLNPRASLTIGKPRGRLTGDFTLKAFRDERTDTTVNLRTSSWNFPAELKLRYPINSRYSVASTTSYARISYLGADGLADYTDLAERLTLAYAINSRIDLTAGYSTRFSRTSFDTRAVDHGLNVGLSGAVGPKMRGELFAGYQTRIIDPGGRAFTGVSAGADLTWQPRRAWTVTGTLSRDYSTTARADNTERLSARLFADWNLTRRFSLGAGVWAAHSSFLDGRFGSLGRKDTTTGVDVQAKYRMSSRLEIGFTGTRSFTRSSLPGFSLTQEGYSLSVSSHW